MNISIRHRIYLSFSLLVVLFVINGIMTIVTLNSIKNSTTHLSKVVDPSLESLIDFRKMLLESKTFTTNWVFLRFSEEDKVALKKIHSQDYPALKLMINSYAVQWAQNNWVDSLHKIYTGFDELIIIEKNIMGHLKEFSDYDDPFTKFEAERKIEEEILPRTASLMNNLNTLRSHWKNVRAEEDKKVERYSMKLQMFIIGLAVTMILLGFFLSFFMARLIIGPINKIRLIVNDLGYGIISKVECKISNDEIGEMVYSVNNLSKKLQGTAAFATEIGNRNFDTDFVPLGPKDTLGLALIAMRDNLKASDKSANEAQHIAQLGNWELDLITNVESWSDELYNIFGLDKKTVKPCYKSFLSVVHPSDKKNIQSIQQKCLVDHQSFSSEYRIIGNNNIEKIIFTQGKVLLNDTGEIIKIYGTAQDITIRKKSEADLNQSEARYRKIVETAQEGIWMIDENNNTTFVNKKMCEILEYSVTEIMGKNIQNYIDVVENAKVATGIERRKKGISETFHLKFNAKSGRVVWAALSTTPIFDEAGIYNGSLAMVTDITKRQHDEELLQNSQTNLLMNNIELGQKNKELEQFAYVASHDLQEPLSTTISFVKKFREQYFGKLDAKADTYLNYIMQASDRMSVLIKDLLEFSRIGNNKDLEMVNCDNILQDVIEDVNKAVADSHARIFSSGLPVINGYPTEIKQLFQNLIINAIKFGKPDTDPQIKIAATKKDGYWHFSFADNGIGIDKAYNERIFIIFQRLHTRSQYMGSGIGLSHCKKIVELHKGKIWVESKPGEGSTFHFTLLIQKGLRLAQSGLVNKATI